MELQAKTHNALQVVSVPDARIDAAVAIEFKDAMRAQTDDGAPVVVLDLSNVEFIDSSGLGAIVASMKHMGKERKLALAGLTPNVEKVFKLTRMDSVFSVYTTLELAMSELES